MLLSQVPSHFKSRRQALSQKKPGAVFLFPCNEEVLRNPDVPYAYRQESNFYYLSGFDEPESFLVIQPGGKTALFVRRRNADKEMWEGERYGVDRALSVFGVDETYPIDELTTKLPELLKGSEQVYYRLGQHESKDRVVVAALETYRASLGRSGKSLPPIGDPNEILGEMRLFKAPEEVNDLRRACQITALGHKTAMKEVRAGMYEYEIEALLDYVFIKNGCKRVGYGSIVAGGVNAACLHYRAHNDKLRDGELLLIDAAGEYNYYTSDITRTFPIGRSFSPVQAKMYDLVLKAQMHALSLVKPGATLPAIHRGASEVLAEGLLSMGLLKGASADEVIKNGTIKRFYPHNTSHWLGMDVHDVGLYTQKGEPRILEAGMCFTIEPGFYVQPGDTETPAEYHKIGIRIEDDVLVTAAGCDVLTRDAPKTIADQEALRA